MLALLMITALTTIVPNTCFLETSYSHVQKTEVVIDLNKVEAINADGKGAQIYTTSRVYNVTASADAAILQWKTCIQSK